MDLKDKKVIHNTFGKGKIVNNSKGYIKVDFESDVKRFVFPDVFGEFMTIVDDNIDGYIEEKMKEKEIELEKEAIRLEEERAKERERQRILERKKQMENRKIHSELQSVFWLEEIETEDEDEEEEKDKEEEKDEEEKIFEEGKIFVGRFKSGKKEGEPRRLARMNANSGCLLTKRDDDMLEEDRYIVGLFMVEDFFDGREAKDGYIPAHKDYRLRLSEEESKKMLFWNYYKNKKSPKNIVWKSGRQRYFDNIWMAQILQDIIALREESEDQEEAKEFFEYFCRINLIAIEEIPKPDGALMQS